MKKQSYEMLFRKYMFPFMNNLTDKTDFDIIWTGLWSGNMRGFMNKIKIIFGM